MRFVPLVLTIVMVLAGSSAFGQYYLYHAEEYGFGVDYSRARTGEVNSDGFGVTIKSGGRSGIYLGYSGLDDRYGAEASSYGAGYEHYFSPDANNEFRSGDYPDSYVAPILSLGMVTHVYGRGRSAFGGLPSAALGFVFPIGRDGRNVTTIGLSAWLPVVSSKYFDPDEIAWATISSTQSFRITPTWNFILGAAYSVSTEPEARDTFEFRLGLLFAWLTSGEDTVDEW